MFDEEKLNEEIQVKDDFLGVFESFLIAVEHIKESINASLQRGAADELFCNEEEDNEKCERKIVFYYLS